MYLSWSEGENHYQNNTNSDNYGFYTMNVSTGDIHIIAYANKYFVKFLDSFYNGISKSMRIFVKVLSY